MTVVSNHVRRRLRLSLRSLLLLLTCFSIWLGYRANQAAKQRKALRIIEACGGYVSFDYEFNSDKSKRRQSDRQIPGPAWLRSRIGDDMFRTVVQLHFEKSRVDDEDLKKLTRLLPHVWSVWLVSTSISDEGAKNLTGFRRLEKLSLEDTNVGDTGVASLLNCKRLRYVSLMKTKLTDRSLHALSDLKKLDRLGLAFTAISNEGLEYFAANTKSRPALLWLRGTQIDDRVIPHLISISSLELLTLQSTSITSEGVDRLRQQLPKCFVVHGKNPDLDAMDLHIQNSPRLRRR